VHKQHLTIVYSQCFLYMKKTGSMPAVKGD